MRRGTGRQHQPAPHIVFSQTVPRVSERYAVGSSAATPGRGSLCFRVVRTLELRTETKSALIEITDDVARAVNGTAGAAVLVYVPHTTAAVTINEKIDPVLLDDLDRALVTVAGDPGAFEHDDEDGPNGTSHLRSTLVGPQLLVPLRDDGTLALGTYQGIFFCEFDGPRDRRVHVSVLQ